MRNVNAQFYWSANTPSISVRGVLLRWVVFDAELSPPGASLLGAPVGVVARVRLQVFGMERFGARVGRLATRALRSMVVWKLTA